MPMTVWQLLSTTGSWAIKVIDHAQQVRTTLAHDNTLDINLSEPSWALLTMNKDVIHNLTQFEICQQLRDNIR